jgi:hypothetical protein
LQETSKQSDLNKKHWRNNNKNKTKESKLETNHKLPKQVPMKTGDFFIKIVYILNHMIPFCSFDPKFMLISHILHSLIV